MKYWIKNNHLMTNDTAVFCPFNTSELACGTWCPLFEVEMMEAIGIKIWVEARLHCGAGTRVIELSEQPEVER